MLNQVIMSIEPLVMYVVDVIFAFAYLKTSLCRVIQHQNLESCLALDFLIRILIIIYHLLLCLRKVRYNKLDSMIYDN